MLVNSIDHLHTSNLNIGKKKIKAQVNLKQLYYFKSRDHSINSTQKSLSIKPIIVLT